MKKEVQKGRKGKKKYSDEELGGIIGEIWYNRLKDKKRKTIYNRHGKSKDPNK